MEIKEVKTDSLDRMIEFTDQSASDLRLWVEEHSKQGKGTKVLFIDTDSDYFKFLQEDIKSLLPYLQAFAETGTLEPATTLQGDTQIAHASLISDPKIRVEKLLEMFQVQEGRIDILEKEKRACFSQIDNLIDENADLEEKLETMQEAGVAMASNITDQGKRIDALENLVREWRHYYQIDALDDDSEHYARHHEIFRQTAQLLGEEPQS
jgi:hypothetical protein